MTRLKHTTLALACTLIYVAQGQNIGPGSVGTTDGQSNLILWLDASQIEEIYNGNNLTTWQDLSGNGSDFTATSKPNYFSSFLNGQPVVRFSESGNEQMIGTHTLTSAPATIFTVFIVDKTNQADDDNDYVYSFGSNNSTGRQASLTRRRANDGSNGDKYYSWDANSSGTPKFGPQLNSTWYISTQQFNTSSPYHSLSLNGASQTLEEDYESPGLNNVSNEIRLGAWTQFSATFDNHLNGYIAEFAIYDDALQAADITVIQNYLSGKYDIAITNDYFDGDEMVNGDNDLDITGVAMEADESKESASSAGLEMTVNSGLANGDYLFFGHKFETNSIITSDIGHASTTLEARWDRYWYIDITDADASVSVDISFDAVNSGLGFTNLGTASDYLLVHRATESGNWTSIATASTVIGDVISFWNLSLTDDGYYTLATRDNTNSIPGNNFNSVANNGPGGLADISNTSDLYLWLDASRVVGEQDDLIITWGDESGHDHDATQLTFSNLPTLQSSVSALNNHNAIRFDEAAGNTSGQFLEGTFSAGLAAPVTLVVIGYWASVNQDDEDNDYFIHVGSGTNADETFSISRRRLDEQPSPGGTDYPDTYYSWSGTSPPRYGPTITGQSWNLYMQTIDASATYHNLYMDGILQTKDDMTAIDDYTGALSTNTSFSVGKWAIDNNNFLDGDIAEIILFNTALNKAQRNILHNYLSAKYALSIDNTVEFYSGDDSGNGNYDVGVSGIGQESGLGHTTATSDGLTITHSSGMEDGDYIIFGHNISENSAVQSDPDFPEGVDTRSDRHWFVEVTNGGATPGITTDITFDQSELGHAFPTGTVSNFKLLFRATSSASWSILASADAMDNDQITFSGVEISGTGLYTIATTNKSESPLPILLHSFDARNTDMGILLEWATAAEINNEKFSVERSVDALTFNSITTLKGAGNSRTTMYYQYLDSRAPEGLNYYRLKQTDFDGTYSYSPTILVSNQLPQKLVISQNPNTDGTLTLRRSEEIEAEVMIFDLFGKNVLTRKLRNTEIYTQLSIAGLPPGIYLLEYRSNKRLERKKLVVR